MRIFKLLLGILLAQKVIADPSTGRGLRGTVAADDLAMDLKALDQTDETIGSSAWISEVAAETSKFDTLKDAEIFQEYAHEQDLRINKDIKALVAKTPRRGLGTCNIDDFVGIIDASGSETAYWHTELQAITGLLQDLAPEGSVLFQKFSNYAKQVAGPGPYNQAMVNAIVSTSFIGGGTFLSTALQGVNTQLPAMLNDQQLVNHLRPFVMFSDFKLDDPAQSVTILQSILASYPSLVPWCIGVGGVNEETMAQLCGKNVAVYPSYGDLFANAGTVARKICGDTTAAPVAPPTTKKPSPAPTQQPILMTFSPTGSHNETIPIRPEDAASLLSLLALALIPGVRRKQKYVPDLKSAKKAASSATATAPNTTHTGADAKRNLYREQRDAHHETTQKFYGGLGTMPMRTHEADKAKWGDLPGTHKAETTAGSDITPPDEEEVAMKEAGRDIHIAPFALISFIAWLRNQDRVNYLELDATSAVDSLRVRLGWEALGKVKSSSHTPFRSGGDVGAEGA